MARTHVVIFQDEKGNVPLLKWLDGLTSKVQDKCIAAVELLAERGNELRRPHCDILEKEIWELRIRRQKVNYRILYAFVGNSVVLLSHGCTKQAKVPKREINRAIKNLTKYHQNPERHTYTEQL